MLLAKLPPIVSGAAITYDLAVVTPIARTNMVTNPSVETATTNYTAVVGSIARSTTYAAHGAYSLAVTPTALTTDGVYYGSISLTSGTTYAASVDILVPNAAGRPYRIAFATTLGVALQTTAFIATGRWQRVSVLYTETSSISRRIYISKNGGTETTVFYIDGLQVEACETGNFWPTTYIDGDQPGLVPNESPPAYLWTGTPHASTSTRSGQTRAGGRVRPFREFGFTPSALIGLGLGPPEHDLVPFSVLDGAQYNDTRKPPRPFTLAGRFDGYGLAKLALARGGLARLLDRDVVARRQPLTLLITPQNEQGKAIGKTGRLTALYTSGLEGDHTNPAAQEVAISFTTVQSSGIQGTDAGAALNATASLTLDYVIQRATTGAWSRVGSGANFNGAVRALARGPDGRIYAAGDFTSAAGGVSAARIAYWDGSAWNAMGTGAGASVRALAVGPDGSIYAGGDFTTMGGVANTSRIARWDGSAWNPLSTGASGNEIYALTMGQDGSLYAGGTFTTIGGTGANRIARWDGSAWSAMGTGAGGTVRALTTMLDGSIVAGGAFIGMGGVTGADRVARWNGSAWVAMGTGAAGGDVYTLAVSPRGTLYAGGAFSSAGGISMNRIAQWNGAQWAALAGGMNSNVYALAVDQTTGTLYAAGAFDTTDSVITLSHLAIWSGATWVAPDTENAGNDILALLVQPDTSLIVGMDAIVSPNWIVAGQTSLTNNGTAVTYPRITLVGFAGTTGSVRTLINIDTGARISFDLDIAGTERVTIDLEPSNIQIVSNIRGLITGTILEGSDTTRFGLQPQTTNTVSILAGNGITAFAMWPERYLAADHLIGVRS